MAAPEHPARWASIQASGVDEYKGFISENAMPPRPTLPSNDVALPSFIMIASAASVALLYSKKKVSRLGAAILIAASLAASIWAGWPWTKSQCITDASNKPTDTGVRIAVKACLDRF